MGDWIPEMIMQNPVVWGAIGTIVGAIGTALLVFHTYGKVVAGLLASIFSTTLPEVEPYYRKRPMKASDWIALRNDGDADANNVRAEINTDEGERSPFDPSDYNRKIPTSLEPAQETKLMVRPSKPCPPPYEVTVTWEDEYGAESERTKIVRE